MKDILRNKNLFKIEYDQKLKKIIVSKSEEQPIEYFNMDMCIKRIELFFNKF